MNSGRIAMTIHNLLDLRLRCDDASHNAERIFALMDACSEEDGIAGPMHQAIYDMDEALRTLYLRCNVIRMEGHHRTADELFIDLLTILRAIAVNERQWKRLLLGHEDCVIDKWLVPDTKANAVLKTFVADLRKLLD